MDTSKIIKGAVSSGRYTVTAPIVKEDYGLYLKIEGVELPQTYEVDFSNSENSGSSVTMIGNADGVLIPRQFIDSGKDVFAFLYHVGEDYGRTVYKFRIPNKVRPDRTDETPTPEEQSTIDQAISALNEAVEQTAQDVESADASAQSAQGYAEQAESARDTAQSYANNAQTSANNASASALQANASATASAQSASQSAQIKSDVEGMVDDAQGYAQASEQSASASAQSASDAQGYAQSASTSETNAQGYASQAQTSANTASGKAQDASTSAQTASQKATESAQSASQALTYKTDAESAKTASQTAQGLAESARDSAITAKTDAESAKDDAVQAKTDVQNIADGIDTRLVDVESALIDKAPIITDTASGAIASFTDGADDLPLKSLVVNIDPVQDLHGQDSPYPAGGGKNLVDVESATVSSQSVLTSVSLTAGTYTLSAYCTNNTPISGYLSVRLSGVAKGTITIGSGDSNVRKSITFTLTDSGTYDLVGSGASSGYNFTITKVQLENGSSMTDFAPYENICPISGWTEVNVEQRGVNVWDEEWELGIYSLSDGLPVPNASSIRGKNRIVAKPSTDYYCNNNNMRVLYYDESDNFLGFVAGLGIKTTPTNCAYIRMYLGNDYGTTYNHDVCINYPSTDHSYHPYTGRSITINLGQTVYGGKLDVLSGELTVYPYYASYNGETLTGEWISDRDKYVSETTPTIGAQVVNIGAQGVTVQLEPHEVNSLLGVNNIWADSGDTSAEYRADTKLFIERLTAPDSADMVADANITSGKYFMVGNSLYKATANIANGSAIVVGTNCIRKSLSEALNEINV